MKDEFVIALCILSFMAGVLVTAWSFLNYMLKNGGPNV